MFLHTQGEAEESPLAGPIGSAWRELAIGQRLGLFRLRNRAGDTEGLRRGLAEVARQVIARHERFDRGWYAGPIGWLDGSGDGEFAVGLRSALVRGSRAWLFAGNGIMADSDPEAELAEVTLKLRPLAEAFGGLVGSKTSAIPA